MTESFKQISERLLNCSNYKQVEEVERDIEKLVEIHHELEQENKELIEALERYAIPESWVQESEGNWYGAISHEGISLVKHKIHEED